MTEQTFEELVQTIEQEHGKTQNKSKLFELMVHFEDEVLGEIDNNRFPFPFKHWISLGNNTRWFVVSPPEGDIVVAWNFDRKAPMVWSFTTNHIEKKFETTIELMMDPSGQTEKTMTTSAVSMKVDISKDTVSRRLKKAGFAPIGQTSRRENIWRASEVEMTFVN